MMGAIQRSCMVREVSISVLRRVLAHLGWRGWSKAAFTPRRVLGGAESMGKSGTWREQS